MSFFQVFVYTGEGDEKESPLPWEMKPLPPLPCYTKKTLGRHITDGTHQILLWLLINKAFSFYSPANHDLVLLSANTQQKHIKQLSLDQKSCINGKLKYT